MENLFAGIVDLRKSGTRAVLSIIVGAEGPTQRKTRTNMAILKDRKITRTVGEEL